MRLVGLAVSLGCSAVLAVAVWLQPDSRGYDTHTQLGLSPCAMPASWGIPCPTCGMTTAFAHMARGRILTAVQTQAFGAALFVVVAVAAIAGAVQAAAAVDVAGAVGRRVRLWWLFAALAGLGAAWLAKILLEMNH